MDVTDGLVRSHFETQLCSLVRNIPVDNTLELSICRMHADVEAALIPLCQSNLEHFKNLNFEKSLDTENAMNGLLQSLHRNTNIETLTLRGELRPENMVHLRDSLCSNENLKVLNIDSNRLSSESAMYLIEGVSGSRSLRKLNASCCILGDEDIQPLGAALIQRNSVETLNLSKNSIGHVGLSALLRPQTILGATSSLKRLDLTRCLLYDEGAEVLVDHLSHVHSLLDLALNHCCFTGAGCLSILKALTMGKTMKNLELMGIQLANNKETTEFCEGLIQLLPLIRVEKLNITIWIASGNVHTLSEFEATHQLVFDALEKNTFLLNMTLDRTLLGRNSFQKEQYITIRNRIALILNEYDGNRSASCPFVPNILSSIGSLSTGPSLIFFCLKTHFNTMLPSTDQRADAPSPSSA